MYIYILNYISPLLTCQREVFLSIENYFLMNIGNVKIKTVLTLGALHK